MDGINKKGIGDKMDNEYDKYVRQRQKEILSGEIFKEWDGER